MATSSILSSGPYQVLYDAICSHTPVAAIYNDCFREFCPHVLGLNKEGKPQVLGYQFGGESKSRPIEPDGSASNWRCMLLDQLTDVHAVPGSWHTAPNHSRPQTCVKLVHIEVTD